MSTVTERVAFTTLPPRSYARSPSATVRPRPEVRHETAYGATRSVPTTTPSASSCTLAMPTSSVARAETVTVPRTSAFPLGEAKDTAGATLSSATGSAARAAAASTRPEPAATQPPEILVADVVSAVRMVSADGVGVVEASRAAMPATNGLADEVPQNWLTAPPRSCAGLQPGAAMSTHPLP
nr:hypothetical protein GCM10020092_098550 [Actinoplanes digitatis]